MVNAKRISWLGTRTEKVEETTAFFRDILGLELLHASPDFTMLRLPGPRRLARADSEEPTRTAQR